MEYVFLNEGKYTEEVQEKFARRFPKAQLPHRNTVRNLIARFRKTGDVGDACRTGRPPISGEKFPTVENTIEGNESDIEEGDVYEDSSEEGDENSNEDASEETHYDYEYCADFGSAESV